MRKMTQEALQADWAVTRENMVRFQERLNAETEDGKFKILTQLLADEFRKFKKEAQ